jgi:hypothetical protein
MKILYRNILILMFTVIMASPLKGYAPIACKIRDSRNCISPEIFERDLADGCASLDGNCRKVFCQKCVDSFDEDKDAQQSFKFRQLCGLQCTVPEALIRFNNPEDRMKLYVLAEMALKERILKKNPNNPIHSIDLLTDLFEERVGALHRYRENSLTYKTREALYKPTELLIHRNRDKLEQTFKELRQNVRGSLDRGVQQGIDRVNQCAIGATQRANQAAQGLTQRAERTAQGVAQDITRKLQQQIDTLNNQIEELSAQLTTASGKKLRELSNELRIKAEAVKTLENRLQRGSSQSE